MIRVLRSRDYLMNFLGFVLLFGFISLGAIGGCSNNNGGGQGSTVTTTALTENDFGTDPGLVADPENNLIVKFLEHPDSGGHENDTGDVGNDVFPVTYKRTLEHTYCWEDDDPEAGHFMELDDSEENEILRLDVNGECVTEIIDAGNYLMTIHHDGRNMTTHPIFMVPNPAGDEFTNNNDDLFNKITIQASKLLNYFTDKAVKEALAANALQTLFTTNKCQRCFLAEANLSEADLSGADLTGATLFRAILRGANLSGTILNGAFLDGAIWCDELNICRCDEASIGTCVGCPPQDTCTGT